MSDDNTMDSVMIDLETMATGPNAGVIQVGAIPFNSRTGLVKPDLFEVDVDLHSALLLGGEVDASTVQFWRDQGGLQPKRPPRRCSRRARVATSRKGMGVGAWWTNRPRRLDRGGVIVTDHN